LAESTEAEMGKKRDARMAYYQSTKDGLIAHRDVTEKSLRALKSLPHKKLIRS
jgi:hypothetical protein